MVSDAYRLRHAARKLDKGTGCESRTVTAAVSAETISVGESQSLGRPEKAGQVLLEARVGRPTVSSECCFGMVMAMFYPSVEHAMTIFCVVSLKLQPNSCFRGRAGRSDCAAEQENGVRVPTLPAL